jgi:hypothetical protein
MRKSIVVFFLFLVQFLSTKAQENLVLNPGFEDMNWCWYSSKYQVYYETMGYFICNKYPYYTNTKNYEPNISEFTNKTWTNPSDSSLLWFNILSKPNNYSPKRGFYGSYFWFLHYTGGALVVNAIKPMLQSSNYGLATACIRLLVEVDHPYNIYRDDNRSFLQGRLSKPLKKGCQYVFKSYVYRYDDNSSYMPYATSSFGVAFVQDSVQYSSYKELIAKHLPDIENPTNRWLNDTADFMLVDGIYTAKGGERYLLLGNFKTNAETPYTPAHVKIPDINNPGNYLRTDINYYIDKPHRHSTLSSKTKPR